MIKTITGFSRYTLSTEGIITDTLKNREVRITRPSNSKAPQVRLVNDQGEGKTLIHARLMALTFIPNPDNKPCVIHKDGNIYNNSLENLEWGDFLDIIKHPVVQNNIHGSYCTKGIDCTITSPSGSVYKGGVYSLARDLNLPITRREVKQLKQNKTIEVNNHKISI